MLVAIAIYLESFVPFGHYLRNKPTSQQANKATSQDEAD